MIREKIGYNKIIDTLLDGLSLVWSRMHVMLVRSKLGQGVKQN